MSLLEQVKGKSLSFTQGTYELTANGFFSLLINPGNALIAP